MILKKECIAMFSMLASIETRQNRVDLMKNCVSFRIQRNQARVVQKVDNDTHRINHYPTDSVVCVVNSCPLDSDLSVG